MVILVLVHYKAKKHYMINHMMHFKKSDDF